MSGFITIRDTNKQLSSGVLPSSLDHGFIPCADKMDECLKQQRSPGVSNRDQADRLLDEILKSSNSPQDDGGSLYVIDDYDEMTDDTEERGMHLQRKSDLKVNSSLPVPEREQKLKKKSFTKLSKVKDVFKSKLQR